jgi:hypothetical protein
MRHWKKHRKHYAVIAVSLAIAQTFLFIGRELLLKRLELSLALAGVGIVLTD